VGRVLKIGHALLRTRDALSSFHASIETSDDGPLCTPESWILAGYKAGNHGVLTAIYNVLLLADMAACGDAILKIRVFSTQSCHALRWDRLG
jgi:hypothetical protein